MGNLMHNNASFIDCRPYCGIVATKSGWISRYYYKGHKCREIANCFQVDDRKWLFRPAPCKASGGGLGLRIVKVFKNGPLVRTNDLNCPE